MASLKYFTMMVFFTSDLHVNILLTKIATSWSGRELEGATAKGTILDFGPIFKNLWVFYFS